MKDVLKNISKLLRKHLCLLLSEVTGLGLQFLLKRRICYSCFSVNFAKCLTNIKLGFLKVTYNFIHLLNNQYKWYISYNNGDIICLLLTPLGSLLQGNIKKSKKFTKIVIIVEENFHIFWRTYTSDWYFCLLVFVR